MKNTLKKGKGIILISSGEKKIDRFFSKLKYQRVFISVGDDDSCFDNEIFMSSRFVKLTDFNDIPKGIDTLKDAIVFHMPNKEDADIATSLCDIGYSVVIAFNNFNNHKESYEWLAQYSSYSELEIQQLFAIQLHNSII
jgi:hypothetical protein